MIATWLALTAALAALALIAVWARRPSRWRLTAVLALPVAACVAYAVLLVPLGKPTASVPPGEYAVLGARIDAPTANDDGAIYILLDDGGVPVYVRLPYSKAVAEQLQTALNGEAGVDSEVTDDGNVQFHERPVAAQEPKRAERPVYEVE